MKSNPLRMRRGLRRGMEPGAGHPLPLDYQSRQEQQRQRNNERRQRRDNRRRQREATLRHLEDASRQCMGSMDPFDWMIVMIVLMVILRCLGMMVT